MAIRENLLYPHIQEFLKSESFGCFKTEKRKGTSFIGVADVIGVRDVGGDTRGDVEVIAVEVKLTPSNFGKILGQALGYSLFAHKCYLAVPFSDGRTYSLEQKELATRLGVGLIEMRKTDSKWYCTHVLTSANHNPLGHQMETLLRRGLGLVRCGFCGTFVELGEYSKSWTKALKNGKTYLIWIDPNRRLLFSRRRKGDWRRLYVCKDCVKKLWEDLAVEEK